jgi:hypothetical protein
LYQDSTVIWAEKNSFHLVDLSVTPSLALGLDVPKTLQFNHLKCNLGIDSLTNEAGAMGGDLDPTKGMYWAWQSGYVNFKMEGKSPICPTWKHKFQLHLGGYLAPFNALQTLDFKIKSIDNQIVIIFDASQFLENIDLKQQHTFMTPDENSVAFAKKASQCFK